MSEDISQTCDKNVFGSRFKDSKDLKMSLRLVIRHAKKIFANTVVFRYTKATDVPPRRISGMIPLPEDEILKYYCKWKEIRSG